MTSGNTHTYEYMTIDSLLSSMSIEHKAGQMLCYGFNGVYPHRDTLASIANQHVAGLRCTPFGRKFLPYLQEGQSGYENAYRAPVWDERTYLSPAHAPVLSGKQFADVMNTLRQQSIETGAGIPLYTVVDCEGNESSNLLTAEMFGFPHPMGLAKSGDPALCRDVAYVIGRQLKAAGIDWLHSPVLDVNTYPDNPEIGTRSYSDDPEIVAEYATMSLEGFEKAGIISTGKHFPGRGASRDDAHFGVPVIDESADCMRDVHLAPYRALINAGLPVVMLAHTVYPSLDPSGEIATLSKPIVTGVLREELAFNGIIMTDSFTMGGLIAKYDVVEAALMSIEAGVDLILMKAENALRSDIHTAIVKAVQSGRISEERITESVIRMLKLKKKYGLLDEPYGIVDSDKTEEVHKTPTHKEVARKASAAAAHILHDRSHVLPIKPLSKVLVLDYQAPVHMRMNTIDCHSGALYEALQEKGVNAHVIVYDHSHIDDNWDMIKTFADEADYIVVSGFYTRGHAGGREKYEKLLTCGSPCIFVTDSPFPLSLPENADAVIVIYSQFATAMDAAANILITP